ncbi:MAG: hypothetical protein EPO26_13240 [Chloroflexota bacterium]|nr:MAG: hypothetical protein EPO26_13240 [Chloroflexota bacterium]
MSRANLARRVTARQGELLGLLARGHTLSAAAAALELSERRAADDLAWACRRLRVRDGAEAVAIWVGGSLTAPV